MKAAAPQMVPLDRIRIDGGTQARVGLNLQVAAAYAHAVQAGAELPPVVVFDDGSNLWLGDGFHRLHAFRRAGRNALPCHVRPGSRRDAVLYAVGANVTHGLQRTTADKRRAIEMLLDDPEWGCRSVRWLAQQVKVSDWTVDQVRKSRGPRPTTVVGRDGRIHAAMANRSALTQDATPALEIVTDAMGRPVPANLVEVFQGVAPFKRLLQSLGQVEEAVKELHTQQGGARLHPSTLKIDLDHCKDTIKSACPYVVCPTCDGAGCKGKRTVCDGRGWITVSKFKQLTLEQRRKCESYKRGV